MYAKRSSATVLGAPLTIHNIVWMCFGYFLSVSALNCGPCDKSSCSSESLNCTGGYSLDVCGCCKICSKLINETCGGPYGLHGKCGEGLECALIPKIGEHITGNEIGICREILPKRCENVMCETHVVRKCSEDSVLIQNDTDSTDCCSKNYECVCNPAKCIIETCAAGFENILHHKAEGVPGSCCDQYVCTRSEKCRSVLCPWTREKECPSDSTKLPSITTEDGCCYQPQGCECKQCPPVECPDNLNVQVITKGTNRPGRCCTRFQCVNETNLNCEYNGETYKNGETWKLDECRICTCNRGLKFCKTETCNNISLCPYMEIPDGACCHVCKGCITDSKKIYNNSDVWKEGDCTTCHCIGGEIQCKSQHCATRCLNPRRVPGQCCPVCDDDESVRQPGHCPDMRNCSLLCPSGFQMSMDGCYRCKCKPENCYLDCEHGYLKDKRGKEICECALPEVRCPSLDSCEKRCTYGFKKSRNGCEKCRCNKCPPFDCSKWCTHGYVVNSQGCKICKCRDRKFQESTVEPTTISHRDKIGKSCVSADGSHHEDGDSWHDGCRLCYCYDGREMCSLISCPRPSCSSPVFRVADCCPTCPGNAILPPSTGERKSCQSANGGFYLEGETWFLDNCTECICHDGSILCETHACPPLLCNYPKIVPGRCCPICHGEEEGLPSPNLPATRMCRTEKGYTYKHGDIWRTSPCQSCTCRNGQVHCFSQTCPAVSCVNTVLHKGSCCPVCLDVNYPKLCADNGITYSSGEQWITKNCSRCYCLDGEIMCIHFPCDLPRCKYLVKSPDQCCPVCLDMSEYTVEPENDKKDDKKLENLGKKDELQEPIALAIICVLAVLVMMLLLLFVFCAFKYHKHKQLSTRKLNPETSDVKPVCVKLLAYETYHVQDNNEKWNAL